MGDDSQKRVEGRHLLETDIQDAIEKIEMGFAPASNGDHLHTGFCMMMQLGGSVIQPLYDLLRIV